MSSKCSSCSQLSQNYEILSCGHALCNQCIPEPNICNQRIVTCAVCQSMTIVQLQNQNMDKSNTENSDMNPQNYVVCLDCKSDLMNIRYFLNSQHRTHNVVPIANIIHDIQKSLRKYQLSFDLQSKGFYSHLQNISKQKTQLAQNYTEVCSLIENRYRQLHKYLQESKKQCLQKYEKIILKELQQYQKKIRSVKEELIRCQSYIKCIDCNLVNGGNGNGSGNKGRAGGNKYVAACQFYFNYFEKMEKQIEKFGELRKNQLTDLCAFDKQKQGKFGINFAVFDPIENKIKELSIRIWDAEQKKPNTNNEIQVSRQVQRQMSATQQYFQQKRRQILRSSSANEPTFTKINTSVLGLQSKLIQSVPQTHKKPSNSQSQSISQSHIRTPNLPNSTIINEEEHSHRQHYNIDGRIQNLRRILKLGEKKKPSTSGVSNTLNKVYSQSNFTINQNIGKSHNAVSPKYNGGRKVF